MLMLMLPTAAHLWSSAAGKHSVTFASGPRRPRRPEQQVLPAKVNTISAPWTSQNWPPNGIGGVEKREVLLGDAGEQFISSLYHLWFLHKKVLWANYRNSEKVTIDSVCTFVSKELISQHWRKSGTCWLVMMKSFQSIYNKEVGM